MTPDEIRQARATLGLSQTQENDMLTKTDAIAYARKMEAFHKVPWAVFEVPAAAPVNQYPANIYNAGRYHACRSDEREDYEAGGAVFI